MTRTLLGRCGGLVASLFALTQVGCYVAPGNVATHYVKSVPVERDKGAVISITADESPELAGTQLVIEPGALAADQTITVEIGLEDIVPGDLHAAGPVAVFGPPGITFSKPARLTMPYAIPAGDDAATLVIHVSEEDGRAWTIPHDRLTVEGNRVSFRVDGFTRFQPGSSNGQPIQDGGGCQIDADCPAGQMCASGMCEAPHNDGGFCTNNAQCPMGEWCLHRVCQPSTVDAGVDGGVDAGAGCTSDADCGFLGHCDPATATCQWNTVDGGLDGGPAPCFTDTDCAPGQLCLNGVCQGSNPDAGVDGGIVDAGQSCMSDNDCPQFQICDPATATCQWNTVDGGPDGGPGGCFTDTDCAPGQLCLNGVCQWSNPDAGVDGGVMDAGQSCTSDNDCPPFQFCNPLTATCEGAIDAGPGPCLADSDCAPGEMCLNGVCQANAPDGGQDGGGGFLSCVIGTPCPGGLTCINGICQ
ncbi:MAG: hypothetical protein IRZ16_16050 [Myxococcaceae bacterium]|nr:hypothetical protein [Myxococcaceae bacterium]